MSFYPIFKCLRRVRKDDWDNSNLPWGFRDLLNMSNFFLDNHDLQFNFKSLKLKPIVDLMENHYQIDGTHPEVHANFEEAMDYYRLSLELLGKICAGDIAPRRLSVDQQGAHLVGDKVVYADGTTASRKDLSEAGFMGAILPRKYGGAHVPSSIYMMMIEMVSRADPSLMTLFGYQDVGELIARFGDEKQAEKYLPKLASGEFIGAIVLTEPGAGSDLQSIRLSASLNETEQWQLNGTKHFISNGCGEVLMVLARSEANTDNIFGLSLFVCSGGDSVKVNRVEEKMGLHGSPTCELLFEDTPVELIGKRRMGLTKYILESLSQARFSVAAQSLGIAQGAYEAALDYARQRKQFSKFIIDIPAVADMLIEMQVSLESSRALLYYGVYWQDLKVQLETYITTHKEKNPDIKTRQKQLRQVQVKLNLLSPMVKYVVTESSTQVAHQAQQVFGGMGYIKETGIEQFVRDIRITTIYEGTSQVQVAASIKAVLADVLSEFFDERESRKAKIATEEKFILLQNKLVQVREKYNQGVNFLAEKADEQYTSACAKLMVDCYSGMLAGHLLLDQLESGYNDNLNNRKFAIANRYISKCYARSLEMVSLVEGEMYDDLQLKELLFNNA